MNINRSKIAAVRRQITLNADAVAALARTAGTVEPSTTYSRPANGHIDPKKPQKTWRTAWRSVVKEAAHEDLNGRGGAI
jgi:hypothetical protein